MPYLRSKSNVSLKRSPGNEVAEPGGRELGMETEVGPAAVIDIQTLESDGCACNHEAALTCGQIIDSRGHTTIDITRCIVDGYCELITLIYQTGFLHWAWLRQRS